MLGSEALNDYGRQKKNQRNLTASVMKQDQNTQNLREKEKKAFFVCLSVCCCCFSIGNYKATCKMLAQRTNSSGTMTMITVKSFKK